MSFYFIAENKSEQKTYYELVQFNNLNETSIE